MVLRGTPRRSSARRLIRSIDSKTSAHCAVRSTSPSSVCANSGVRPRSRPPDRELAVTHRAVDIDEHCASEKNRFRVVQSENARMASLAPTAGRQDAPCDRGGLTPIGRFLDKVTLSRLRIPSRVRADQLAIEIQILENRPRSYRCQRSHLHRITVTRRDRSGERLRLAPRKVSASSTPYPGERIPSIRIRRVAAGFSTVVSRPRRPRRLTFWI